MSLPAARQPRARGDDGDALVAADGQQMLTIPGDNQLALRGHGRRDDVIVIGIARHCARCAQG